MPTKNLKPESLSAVDTMPSGSSKNINTTADGITLGRQSLEYIVENFEKEIILKALETARGNQTKAAGLLLTTKRVIQYKVKKYRIEYRKYRGKVIN
jgi:Nif-specific regulatory protein